MSDTENIIENFFESQDEEELNFFEENSEQEQTLPQQTSSQSPKEPHSHVPFPFFVNVKSSTLFILTHLMQSSAFMTSIDK
jgi:hypothetical protein